MHLLRYINTLYTYAFVGKYKVFYYNLFLCKFLKTAALYAHYDSKYCC